jgi:AsmA-like C-terminal region
VARRHRGLLVTFAIVAIVGVVLLSIATRLSPVIRDRVVAALNARFATQVELESLQVGVFPRPELSGSGLSVRWEGRSDVPPLVRLENISASAGLFGLLGDPVRLKTVELDRLEIYIPPGGVKVTDGSKPATEAPSTSDGNPRLLIDEIVAHAAQLQIASKQEGKLPRVFDIHDLHITGYGKQDGADFRALLTNPKPEGRIETTGRFGPWQREEPRRTPVKGEYAFKRADLDTIKGLGGILSSRGRYAGPLERIEVTGETDTPDFSIDVAGQPVPLTTRFMAVVDGTNGDTWLEKVDARLLESHIHARGAVVRTKEVKGRNVELDITIDQARIEDLLKLAMKGSRPPLTGAVKVKTKFLLPAGPEDVVEKLQLAGEFALEQARFTNFNVQKRISALSQRARGDETPEDGESVVSQLRGRFALKDAALRFSDLTFAMPGAEVQLAGTYHLRNETIDFAGHLLLDASLRDTTSGFKAALATIAQPFFRRPGGGSKVPIRIGGTRDKPQFGLDLKRALLPG